MAMKTTVPAGLKVAAVAGVVLLAVAGMSGCSRGPTPKNAVMDFFTGLHASDTTLLRRTVDFDRAWGSVQADLKEVGDSTGGVIPWGDRLYASLTGEGRLRKRWTKTQIVINKTQLAGDSATVEVSFIDRETGMHYYNRMGLVRRAGGWVIVAFRTM